MRKINDTILISLVITGIIIGLHQTIVTGFFESYWIFMLTLVLFLIYSYSRRKGKK